MERKRLVWVMALVFFLNLSLVPAEEFGYNILDPDAATVSGNLTNFTELLDTPSSYVGDGGDCVKVNGGETALEFGACGGGGGSAGLNASGIYLYNDSTTIFFNTTLAGTNLSVNSSDHWDGFDSANTTQFENQGGVLHIVSSWFSNFFNALFATMTTDNLTEGVVNLYDNQSWNQSLADTLYYNISNPQNYINTSLVASGIYITNTSTTLFFNETLAGTNLSVNSSDYWDGIDAPNLSELDVNEGELGVLDSWLTAFINAFGFLTPGYFDQDLNTTDNVQFNQVNVTDEVFLNNYNVSLAIANSMSTGLIDGGILSINADNTKFDISATTSWFVNNTNMTEPNLQYIECAAFTAVSVTNIATAERSNIALNRDCTLSQKTTPFSNEQTRSKVILGRLVHPNNVNIIATVQLQHYGLSIYNQYLDLTHGIGNINTNGNVYSPSGPNLSIQHTSGEIFRIGSNYENNKDNPNVVSLDAVNPIGFFYRFQDGSGGFTQHGPDTTLNVSLYDDGSGTLASVGNNKYSVQRVFLFSAGQTVIQYGQAIYNKLSEATAAISTEDFNTDPNLATDAVLRGWIVVKGSTTDLEDTTDATIINAGKFGSLGGATGTSAAQQVSLQDAYDNSLEPEIQLDSTNNGLTIWDASTPIGRSLFEIQSDGATINYFNVTANGTFENDSRVCTLKNGICNTSGSNPFDQSLNTTDNVTFEYLNTTKTIRVDNPDGSGEVIIQGRSSGANFATLGLWNNDTSPKKFQFANRNQPGSGYRDHFQFWNYDGTDWFRLYEIFNVTGEWGINMDAVLGTMFSVNGSANFTGDIDGGGELSIAGESYLGDNIFVNSTHSFFVGTNSRITIDGLDGATGGRTSVINLTGGRNGANNNFARIQTWTWDSSGNDSYFQGGSIRFEEDGADDTRIRIYTSLDRVQDLALILDKDGLYTTKDITIDNPVSGLVLGLKGAGAHSFISNKTGLYIGDAASQGQIHFGGTNKVGKIYIHQLINTYTGGSATVCVDDDGLLTAVDGGSC